MKYKHLVFFLAALLCASLVRAQSATISVAGEVTQPLKLTAADLAKMKQVTVTAQDREGKEHHYSGVAVSEILQQAGVTMGPQLRGENMSKYLLVRSGDGYEVLFSLPELDTTFSSRVIILASQVDGAPLPGGKGPFRIVVPGEKKPARWIWEVTSMTVRFAKE